MFIRFILYFLLAYLIIRTIRSIFYPSRVKSRQGYRAAQTRKKGDVTIDVKPSNKKKISKDTGDYIDYEELKD